MQSLRKKSTAQGTIEYLVIMAIVIVIALVLVGILSGFFGGSGESTGFNAVDVGNKTNSGVAILETVADSEGDSLVRLTNNSGDTITINKVTTTGGENSFNETLPANTERTFSLNDFDLSCPCDGQSVKKICEFTIQYTNQYGLEKSQNVRAVVDCVNDARAGGNTPVAGLGSGTLSDPWIINSCAELQDMNNHLDGNYALGGNINCADSLTWNNGAGFSPIGFTTTNGAGCPPDSAPFWDLCLTPDTQYFNGTLDGKGFTISNFYINRLDENFVGLFKVLGDTARITNLNFTGANVTGGSEVGTIAGMNYSGYAERVIVNGDINGGAYVGGLFGSAAVNSDTNKSASIYLSGTSGKVNGGYRVGCLVGNGHSFTIDKSYSTCDVNAVVEAGGLVGTVWYNTVITRSYATGNATADQTLAGGLASASNGTIRDCYATGNVIALSGAGGLMGGGGALVMNSYATGTVTSPRATGGLIGDTIGAIVNSFATGRVTGDANVGGVAGVVWDAWCQYDENVNWSTTNTTMPDAYGAWYANHAGGCGINNYTHAVGVNNPDGNYEYWYNPTNTPLQYWGGFGSDKNWNICSGQGFPWLSWENRTC